MIKFTLNLKLSGQAAARLKSRQALAVETLTRQVISDTESFVPFRTGELQTSVQSQAPGVITYSAPHARKLYYGLSFNFNRGRNPQAGPFWFGRAKAVWGRTWLEKAAAILRGKVK